MPDRSLILDFEEAHDAFRRYLRRQGIKNTRARRAILDMVLKFREHFEAEQLLFALREAGYRVGKATVYRTLPLLVDARILKVAPLGAKQTYYEIDFGQTPHDHMVCRRCGIIFEFNAEDVIALRERIARKHDFIVDGHRFQLLGWCRGCYHSQQNEDDSPSPPPSSHS